jgi:hypothetical protein
VPSGQAALSRTIGVTEYIAFSAVAGKQPMPIFSLTGHGVSGGDATMAARKFVNVPADLSRKPLPNVVFFHAESSFDPNVAFKLSKPVQLMFWSRKSETRALAPLRTNVVGGGTWVTEFEVLTGIDARVLGYQGFYTHYYVAPKVKNSFVRYLVRKGYRTRTFYSVPGSFYNAEAGFRKYGFADFMDGSALGLPENWERIVDEEIIASSIEHGAFNESGPFFYFLNTLENHGPHPCRHFSDVRQFLTTFQHTDSFEMNCQLNEYIRRAISTSHAAERVLAELKRIEQQTGRPFILLIYGDHQPWSFTGVVGTAEGGIPTTALDFSAQRTDAGIDQTFFHLLASDNTVLSRAFTKAVPTLLLPTLISAYVATSYEDLYLPANFLAVESCGSDIRRGSCEQFAEVANSWRETLFTTQEASRSDH